MVIDEAYVDFGAESAVSLLDKCDNLLVVQTIIEIESLAGARVGLAISIRRSLRISTGSSSASIHYNLNRLSILAGAEH